MTVKELIDKLSSYHPDSEVSVGEFKISYVQPSHIFAGLADDYEERSRKGLVTLSLAPGQPNGNSAYSIIVIHQSSEKLDVLTQPVK